MKSERINSYLSFGAIVLFLICYFMLYALVYLGDLRSAIMIFILALWPLIIFIFVSPFLGKKFIHAISLLLTLFYFTDVIALSYKSHTNYSFNFFYFWYNLSVAWETLVKVFSNFLVYFLIFILIAILFYRAIFVLAKYVKIHNQRQTKFVLPLLATLTIACFIFLSGKVEVLAVLADSWKINTNVAKLYDQYYWQSIDRQQEGRQNLLLADNPLESRKNIFFIHLESLNSTLVNEQITPNFWQLADQGGIVYQNLQTNNVQTIRAQENILCSVLPSLRQNLHSFKIEDRLYCLPKILKQLGYKTLFFKSYDLDFSDTGNFMLKLGFDEVHAEDIMQPEDQAMKWGFREDLYYQRVMEYLQKYQQEKIFAYIAVSSSNHYPFTPPEENFIGPKDSLPNPQPDDFKQRIGNTTWLQDYFFGQLMEKWRPIYGQNSLLIAYGDQAWPTGEHNNNQYNEIGAWQENFLSSLAIVTPTSATASTTAGRISTEYVSLNDLMPTALGFAGLNDYQTAGNNLLAPIDGQHKCIVSAQPYSRVFLAALQYPIKYIYDLMDNKFAAYDLAADPGERRPLDFGPISNMDFLEQCLKNITAE